MVLLLLKTLGVGLRDGLTSVVTATSLTPVCGV